jgi:hypothetical protein
MCENVFRLLVLVNARIPSLIQNISQPKCPLCELLPNDNTLECSFLSEENGEDKFILDSTPLC